MTLLDKSQKKLLGIVIAIVVVGGLVAVTANSLRLREDGNKAYGTLESLDDSYLALISGGDSKSSLRNAKNWYDSIVVTENFDDRPQLRNLDNSINQSFESMTSQDGNITKEKISDLRSKISEMGGSLGVELPLGYEYSYLVLLGISLSLSFLVTILCRKAVDWDKLREAKRVVEEWNKKITKAQNKRKGKKKKKLEMKTDKVNSNQEKIWAINGKQAVFYLVFFLVFLAWLAYVYHDWIVVWLPFTWFKSGSLSFIGASLGSFGWFLISYFGFSQVWRSILLPSTDVEEVEEQ